MGTYCELFVADSPVFAEKSQANALVMTIFRESDRVIATRSVRERNPIQWDNTDAGPDESELIVEYTTSVGTAKDRLRVMGFTLKSIKADFEKAKATHIMWLKELSEGGDSDLWSDEIALLSNSSFADFVAGMKEIVTSGVHYVWFTKRVPNGSALAKYMLKDNDDFYWGFPCTDLRCFIRALLESVPDGSTVTQELTDLVDGEYYPEDARVTDLALQELKGSYSINSPVIVLTEGVTDSRALQQPLSLLYPHLLGYFSFMDLAVRSPGGAGSLVHVVKSFAGAGIENRVIALFDNDTAGHAALSLLRDISLPQTMRILSYPDLALAALYPTAGPTGTSVQNINGLACSIELFFGRDVLEIAGQLVPVQWKGYDERMKRYQGEITNKNMLCTRFDDKVQLAKSDRSMMNTQDWEPMRQLLDVILDAFND
jgi:HEPN/Toprim N-terminal domain 1